MVGGRGVGGEGRLGGTGLEVAYCCRVQLSKVEYKLEYGTDGYSKVQGATRGWTRQGEADNNGSK